MWFKIQNSSLNVKNNFEKVVGIMLVVTLKVSNRGGVVRL